MRSRIFSSTAIAVSTLVCLSTAASAQSLGLPRITTLPSARTQSAIEALPKLDQSATPAFRELSIDSKSLPKSSQQRMKLNDSSQAAAPFLVPNTMVLQFEPNASKESIDALLARRNLKVIDTFPKIGAVKVEADLSKYFTPELTDQNANQTLLRGMANAITDFKSESIVRSATPDVLLQTQADEIVNLMKASDVKALVVTTAGETVDWGVGNIEADKLWTLPHAQDGVLFGVLDVGFARHEDISFIEMPAGVERDDHGNHVAAIACGRHNNGRGIRGVLPNCFVRARTGDVFFRSTQGGQVLGFMVVFSQILKTLEKFIDQYDDVKTFNLSMGYNWRSNFGINPDLPESAQWRTLVESQGTMLVSALELADKAGRVIFSAAGNDSSNLPTPINAKYASPFNWAAITAREKNITRNGIVVEAHNANNRRAPFSNVGGHMSCPGVDVLSAVAHDANGSPSPSRYGRMSGTSMASPYCASAHLLFALVRPGYTGTEIVDCMMASSTKSDSGAPIPKLTQALAKCPPKN